MGQEPMQNGTSRSAADSSTGEPGVNASKNASTHHEATGRDQQPSGGALAGVGLLCHEQADPCDDQKAQLGDPQRGQPTHGVSISYRLPNTHPKASEIGTSRSRRCRGRRVSL
jgi:hypothetical protein